MFDEGAILLIDPELIFLLVVGDEEIEPAIAIEVGRDDAKGAGRTAGPAPRQSSHRRTSRRRGFGRDGWAADDRRAAGSSPACRHR